MRSTLRKAKKEDIEYLVLGASGCGAFEHDPVVEAKAWAEVGMVQFRLTAGNRCRRPI